MSPSGRPKGECRKAPPERRAASVRHQPRPTEAAQPSAADRHAARLRWFLVGHVLAVLLIYAVALFVGGGWAPAPFPPDVPVRAQRSVPPPAPGRAAVPVVSEPRTALVMPTAAPDLAPPWAHDTATNGAPPWK